MLENKFVEKIAKVSQSDMSIIKDDFLNFIIENVKDIFKPLSIACDVKEFIFTIPNQIFFNKMKRFLSESYCELDLHIRVRFAQKFSEDDYTNYVKRQIELINSINDENKIDYLANLTRACILGFIDTNVYFKLSNIINQTTIEELKYLSKYIDKEIEDNNAYIYSLQQIGLVKQDIISGFGENIQKYSYTEFGKAIDKFAIKLNKADSKYKYDSNDMLTLENMIFSETSIQIDEIDEGEFEDNKSR